MKSRRTFLIALLGLVPSGLSASMTRATPRRDLSGTIVEIHKRQPILVLENFQGWDREQTTKAAAGERADAQRWLKGLGPKQAAIYLKAEDMKALKVGMIVRIKGYRYAFSHPGNGHAPVSLWCSYDELKTESGKGS